MCRVLLLLICGFSIGLIPDGLASEQTPGKDKPATKTLAGTWQVTKHISSTGPAPEAEIKDFTFEFKGNKLIMLIHKDAPVDELTFKSDGTKSPPWLDLEDKFGSKILCIYRFNDHGLEICMSAYFDEKPSARPTEFKAGEKSVLEKKMKQALASIAALHGDEKGTQLFSLDLVGRRVYLELHATASARAPGGLVYHVLNRAVARLPLFQKPDDFEAFERIVVAALAEHPTRLLAYCLMPNHWHLVLWPSQNGELSAFVRWLTHTHSMRWHAHYRTSGTGHIYQGRFKSFPVQTDEHLYTVLRYVERNALRARLVRRAENWRWSSLWHRQHPGSAVGDLLHRWPKPELPEWLEWVNAPQTPAEMEAVRAALKRGRPFGSAVWQRQTAQRLGLEYTMRGRGRPKKRAEEDSAGSLF